MPSYVPLSLGKYEIWVEPSDFRRSIIKETPYYNGVDIWFKLKVNVPAVKRNYALSNIFPRPPHIDETLNIEWELFDRDERQLVVAPTPESYHLQNKGIKHPNVGLRKYSWNSTAENVQFTIYRGIHIGRLWEFHRFDLRVGLAEGSKEKQIAAEFTLRDIDEHGENYHNLVFNLILGAIISFIVTFITIMLFGR